MAKTLGEVVRQNLQAPATGLPQRGGTEAADAALRAKTGKAVGSAGARRSTMAEQAVIQQAQAGAAQQQTTGVVQAEQLATTEEQQNRQFGVERKQLTQATEEQRQQMDLAISELSDDLRRNREQMTSEQKVANLEHIGFLMALQDSKYIHNLQMEGERQRLGDEQQFEKWMTSAALGDQMASLKSDLEWQELMNMEEADFLREMGNMDMDFAMQMSTAAAKEKAAQQVAAGSAAAIEGGAKVYAAKQAKDEKEADAAKENKT